MIHKTLAGLLGGLGGISGYFELLLCCINKNNFMFSSISWPAYFTICGLALLVYYIAIGILFYRNDLLLKFNRSNLLTRFTTSSNNGLAGKENSLPGNLLNEGTAAIADENDITENLKNEIQALTVSTGKNFNKAELLYSLQRLLKKYAVIQSPFLQEIINEVIMEECKTNCGTALEETELIGLWRG